MSELSREEVLTLAASVARTQVGGALATMHAEDGTPYVTFVLFHLRDDGTLLFGSSSAPQHTSNIRATPEVSFLIDNREVISTDWTTFDRVVIEGRAATVAKSDPDYESQFAELRERNRMAAYFAEQGDLYRIVPRRLIVMRGFAPERHVVDFEEA